jgi:hypothetical protein
MKHLVKTLKELSCSGVLLVYLGGKKVRIVSSSNFVSSIQRILPELGGSEKIEVLSSNLEDRKLRSLTCYIHKKRLERLGFKVVKCSVKRWWLDKRAEEWEGSYKWIVRAKNTYNSLLIGIFDKEEMDEFLEAYYPCGVISAAIISSNKETKKYYEIHPEG